MLKLKINLIEVPSKHVDPSIDANDKYYNTFFHSLNTLFQRYSTPKR